MSELDKSNKANESDNNSQLSYKENFLQMLTLPDKLLLAGALVMGILFVWLFYGKYPGVSIPIFIIAFYAVMLAYTQPVLSKEARFGWFLSIPIFMLSLTYLLFGNKILMILNLLALLTLVLLQTLLITSVNSFKWYSPGILLDLFCGIFYRCMAHVLKPFGIIARLIRKKTNENKNKSIGIRVLTGLLISLPLLIVLLALLSSADMVFGRLVERLPEFFENMNLSEFIGKSIVVLIVFFISFSYLWSLRHGDRPADSALKSVELTLPSKKISLDIVTIITITAAVDILYIVFVVIQFAYLFGGSGLPEGFTYAEYARSGFFELILVTLLNIGLMAGSLTFTGKGGKTAGTAFRLLNTIMICCTFVMLFSAHYRMSLYERAYGYTFLRIMTHAFMVFLLVLFVITLARVWVERLPLLKPYIVVAIVAFTVVNYINVDKLIVKMNIERYYSTNVIDIAYFRSLSNDIVADIKKLAEDKDPNVASAAKELLDQRKKQLLEDSHWQSFNLADYKARNALGK